MNDARSSEPDGAPGPVTYRLASYSSRVWAFLIDLLPLFLLTCGVVVGVALNEGTPIDQEMLDDERTRELVQRWSLIVTAVFGLLYAPLLMIRRGARNGQTLGKQAMGIRVVRENGAPVTLGNALMREFVGRQLLTFFTRGVYTVVDYAWPLWDRGRQALHDKIAQTRVVAAAPVAQGDFTTGFDAHAPLAEHEPATFGPGERDPEEAEPQPATGAAAPPPPPRDDSPVRDGWLPPRAS